MHMEQSSACVLERELTARGVRLTRQRKIIVNVIETAGKHLDAAQTLRRAARLDPGINRVTVYRTLGLLKRLGLIDELDLLHVNGEGHYYEPRPKRDHLHLTCFRCRKTVEFESALFERLKGQVERECDFRIELTRVEVGGVCAKCRK
ncbi:MAG: Fur family transcriptional regulator [Terriglobales bacterium]